MIRSYLFKLFNKKYDNLNQWAIDHLVGLFIFNIIMSLLVLLNTAEYFKPFFFLGINVIFFIGLILSIPLLGARSKSMFFISIIFLVFAIFLKILKIEIWAERTAVYTFQSLLIGVILLTRESINKHW
ncbi:hypothetical protein A2130_03680 [Candidatus Woesebacteria bacterium GWC2_33_12]|uniref:Uncharacterized protein n=1 Tax=Candidatus Woesebacteria bacterium GW2011_GWB1_33_22 TaxID=1618566 RepID=A0A0G0C2R5_9BACT|nr:MAG: hypothetical protein UR29_C0001G0055 [Candidatus Woesebacteria bacterium GW2011_GWC2_33_12]KKP42735.1 MAG: hypothetical protein UR33_C0001G0096 [Candidatus Woesebacteria bacterium GW2011_GWA2_33_20]KKP45490.1 MAG: hypothetical protein UR35_C0001G0087 [Candidatus Woesebacteria bacterium GW2011_GWB1_33_22]KKP47362.1 MAG: hypothetical protein UR37_C0001G0055 [Microgenomates group bacterium GW2011_GWC1_33_28]KKP51108.1 MAG: hypothetical protein UR41_C0001G0055 [Candidatus Woesebacteria bact